MSEFGSVCFQATSLFSVVIWTRLCFTSDTFGASLNCFYLFSSFIFFRILVRHSSKISISTSALARVQQKHLIVRRKQFYYYCTAAHFLHANHCFVCPQQGSGKGSGVAPEHVSICSHETGNSNRGLHTLHAHIRYRSQDVLLVTAILTLLLVLFLFHVCICETKHMNKCVMQANTATAVVFICGPKYVLFKPIKNYYTLLETSEQ